MKKGEGYYCIPYNGRISIASQETLIPAALEPRELAANLEIWIYDYKKLWRTISEESELFQIENLFFWYAGFLRQL